MGEANVPAYNYSKGGVRIFTKSAALHCCAQGYPIRVNSVHPGFILTAMVEEGIGSMPEDIQQEMNLVIRIFPKFFIKRQNRLLVYLLVFIEYADAYTS